MNVSVQRTHELYDLGLAYIRAAIRANLAEVDTEIASAGILHPALHHLPGEWLRHGLARQSATAVARHRLE